MEATGIHLAKRFQRRRLKQELSVVAMFVNGSEINKLLIFIEDLPRTQTWPPQAILVSDWLISKKSYSLKLLCQMNQNLVGSILGRSSITIVHLDPIH
jgi:hypothetical protein